jgi:glutamate-ammonia-ligase adenylyltransferase
MALVRQVLAADRDPDQLVIDVADMRDRMAASHPRPPLWDVKHLRGGLVDVEFIAQYLQLREASRHPEALRQNTGAALAALAAAGILAPDAERELGTALALWRNVQGLLKLLVEDEFDEAAAPPALKSALARGAGAADFDGLKSDILAAAARVRAWYASLIDRPAAQARERRT